MIRYAWLAIAMSSVWSPRKAAPASLFLGHWAFELPDGNPAWLINEDRKKNGWRAEAGILIKETPKTDFGAYGS